MSHSPSLNLKNLFYIAWLVFLTVNCSPKQVHRQREPDIKLGAYYFDGWSGLTQYHITPQLLDSFPDREPKWGWITSQQQYINDQIDLAADAGLYFFSFCWYYPQYYSYEQEHLNRALNFYLKAPNKSKLKFNILVVNHEGFIIGPAQWNEVSEHWIKLMRSPEYVKVNEKPLLTFFSAATLVNEFGSAERVHSALDNLRTAAKKYGLKGLSLAVCVNPDSASIELARACGFDILTGYNYHAAGFQENSKVIPIDSLISGSCRAWNNIRNTGLPYIPVATLNWDPRPWSRPDNNLADSPRYIGFSDVSVHRSVQKLKHWIKANPENTLEEKIALVYAWNEYGEGAWLTPSRTGDQGLLKGVKKALKE